MHHRPVGHMSDWVRNRRPMLSTSWAIQADQITELVVCETRPTQRVVDRLIGLIQKHGATPKEDFKHFRPGERNALKKVIALRESASHTLWVPGPNDDGFVFAVARDKAGSVVLTPTGDSALHFERGRAEVMVKGEEAVSVE